MMLQMKFVTWL